MADWPHSINVVAKNSGLDDPLDMAVDFTELERISDDMTVQGIV